MARWPIALLIAFLFAGVGPAWPPRRDALGDPLPARAVARLGTIRLRHAHYVTCAVFSPDGKTLASGSRLGDLRLWDVLSGREIRSFPGHRFGVNGLVFSPDGKWLISGGGEPSLRIHDVTTGEERPPARRLPDTVWSVTVSPDGKTLAVGGGDGRTRLYDFGSLEELHVLGNFFGSICSLVYSRDGKTLAAGGTNGAVRLWDLATRTARVLREDDLAHAHLSLSSDGTRLLATGSTLQVWDPRSGKRRRVLNDSGNSSAALLSPAGDFIVASQGAAGVRFWDTLGGLRPCCIRDEGNASCFAFSPDGNLLAVGRYDGVLRVVDLRSCLDLHPPEGHVGSVRGVAFAPDGKSLATAGDTTVRLWDRTSLREVRQFPVEDAACGVAFSPDGRRLAAAGEARRDHLTLRVWDPASGRLLASTDTKGSGTLEQPERPVEWLASLPGAVTLIRRLGPRGGLYWSELLILGFTASALSPNGKVMATAHPRNDINLWTLPNGDRPRLLKGHRGSVHGLAFTPDGQYLVSASRDETVRLWEVASGEEVLGFVGHECAVAAVALTKDGRLVASGGTDGMICLWDLATGQLLRRHTGHRGEILGLAFAPDGRLLASASSDATVLLWEVHATDLAPPLPLAFSPAELDDLWIRLMSPDAITAYKAAATLRRSPTQVGPFLEKRLKAWGLPTPERIQSWITDLDHPRFRTRQNAQEELTRWGPWSRPSLERRLQEKPTLEVRRRIEAALGAMDAVQSWPEIERLRRVTGLLGRAGTPEARRVLDWLAATGMMPGELRREDAP